MTARPRRTLRVCNTCRQPVTGSDLVPPWAHVGEIAMIGDDGVALLEGDALHMLQGLADGSVSCCVTSPPYWGLRAYKAGAEEIGTEPTPDAYVAALVAVFREVRRVLRDDGTLWLNLGDAYNSLASGHNGDKALGSTLGGGKQRGSHAFRPGAGRADGVVDERGQRNRNGTMAPGLKPKDLIGLPWMVAFALRADGWYLRSDIIWSKPNPMPESVTDRPTKAHEYVLLLSKSARYFFDQDAVRIGLAEATLRDLASRKNPGEHNGLTKEIGKSSGLGAGPRVKVDKQRGHGRRHDGFNDRWDSMPKPEQQAIGANIRTVWTIATRPSPLPHFAAFPDELAERCIKAGCPQDGTVLDPFAGTGTTLKVARDLGRKAIGIELNAEYCDLARKRLAYGVKGVLAIENGQGTLAEPMQFDHACTAIVFVEPPRAAVCACCGAESARYLCDPCHAWEGHHDRAASMYIQRLRCPVKEELDGIEGDVAELMVPGSTLPLYMGHSEECWQTTPMNLTREIHERCPKCSAAAVQE